MSNLARMWISLLGGCVFCLSERLWQIEARCGRLAQCFRFNRFRSQDLFDGGRRQGIKGRPCRYG